MTKYLLALMLLTGCTDQYKVGTCFQYKFGIARIDKIRKYGVETTTRTLYSDNFGKEYFRFDEINGAPIVDCESWSWK